MIIGASDLGVVSGVGGWPMGAVRDPVWGCREAFVVPFTSCCVCFTASWMGGCCCTCRESFTAAPGRCRGFDGVWTARRIMQVLFRGWTVRRRTASGCGARGHACCRFSSDALTLDPGTRKPRDGCLPQGPRSLSTSPKCKLCPFSHSKDKYREHWPPSSHHREPTTRVSPPRGPPVSWDFTREDGMAIAGSAMKRS